MEASTCRLCSGASWIPLMTQPSRPMRAKLSTRHSGYEVPFAAPASLLLGQSHNLDRSHSFAGVLLVTSIAVSLPCAPPCNYNIGFANCQWLLTRSPPSAVRSLPYARPTAGPLSFRQRHCHLPGGGCQLREGKASGIRDHLVQSERDERTEARAHASRVRPQEHSGGS